MLSNRDEEDLESITTQNSAYKDTVKSRQLQQTVLLKYKTYEQDINKNLADKRRKFQKRMKECKEKQEHLIKKQHEVLKLSPSYR